jgi:hypothetical protein
MQPSSTALGEDLAELGWREWCEVGTGMGEGTPMVKERVG